MIGVTFLVVGSLLFPYVLGLHPSVAVVLFFFTVGTALGIYRLLNRSAVAWDHPLSRAKLVVGGVAGLVVVALAIQAVPYGRDHSNPPVSGEPAWDSPRTRELTVRACFDCHSNEVEYPWYSGIAPMSWAVQLHVEQGRGKVNYSEWDHPQEEADESAETVIDGYTVAVEELIRLEGEVATAAEAMGLAAAPMAAGGLARTGGYAISQRDNAQHMQKSSNMAAQNAFMDEDGTWQRLGNIRNIGQRGFIQQGEQWVDSRLRIGTEEELKPEIQVQAFSDAHFQLAREFPGANSMLAAADDLLILINGHVVQIGAEGQETLSAADLQLLQAPAEGDDVGAAPGPEEDVAARALGGIAGIALALGAALTRIGS